MSTPLRLRDDASCPPELLEALRVAGRAAPTAEQVRSIGLGIQARAMEPERLLEADGGSDPLQQALSDLGGWKPLPDQRARITERLGEARGLSQPTSPRRAWRPRPPARFAAVGLALLASSAAAAVGWMAIERAPVTGIAPPAPRSGERLADQQEREPQPRHAPVQPPASVEKEPASREERHGPPFELDSGLRVEPWPIDEPSRPRGNRQPSDAAKSNRRGPTRAAPAPAPAARDPLGELEAVRATRRALRTDPARALTLAREHRRKYADGVLAQESDVLLLEALDRLNRDAELRSEAEGFRRRYPGSPHLGRVEALSRSASGTNGSAPTP